MCFFFLQRNILQRRNPQMAQKIMVRIINGCVSPNQYLNISLTSLYSTCSHCLKCHYYFPFTQIKLLENPEKRNRMHEELIVSKNVFI